MADTWTMLSGYTASNYVDTMIFEVVSATKKIRPLSGQTLVAGEKNSQYVRFEMDRFWDGIDISAKNFSITYSLAGKYYGTSEAVSAEVSTDKLRFGWIVPEEACCIAGTLMFVLVIKSDGYVLKTQIAETPVVKSLDEESVVPEPTREAWYKEFQVRVQEDLDASQAALTSAQDALTRANTANDAASSALTAASEANLAAQDAIEVAKIRYGSPLMANAGPEMVDTNRVYVFTGSESAYTYGHWYYYDNGVWNDGGVYNGNGVNTDKTLSIENMPADAKKTGDEISELKEDLNSVTEDYGVNDSVITTPVTLNLSDVNAGYRSGDTVGNGNRLTTSTVTTCIKSAFTCEAGKDYILTITNGDAPARIVERGTVVVFVDNKVAWSKKTTNTTAETDVVEFTPTVSGDVWFNLDLNYVDIAVVLVETQTTTEKTAIDKQARSDVADMSEAVEQATEGISALTVDVERLNEATESITETSVDGTVVHPVVIDLSDIHIGAYCNGTIGQNIGYHSSTVTTCIANAFECEAGKTYKITVTNGNTPASLSQRAIVIYGANDKVVWYTYYRNTANLNDVITFTPTESGFVYINVDINYNAVSSTVEAENIVFTAVDAIARKGTKFILNGTVAKEVVFEEGTFDAALADAVGTGYRSNVITGVDGCVVCIKVNPSYAFIYGDGVNALMSIYGIYVIHCISGSFRIGLSDTPENVGFEMRIYRERGHKGKYDVIVAATDSSDDDKAKADIICDGVNDELDLQFAVNWNYGRQARNRYQDMCNVLLMPGTYNIDDFTQQYTADGHIMRSKNAVVMGNHSSLLSSSYTYRPTISGCYETEHGFYDAGVLINVTANGVNALDAELDNVLFGIPLDTNSVTGAIRMNNLSVGVYNLCIFTNGINNKIICIDGYQAGNTVVKNCDIWSTKGTSGVSAAMIAAIPEGSIGIRAGRGSCLGVRQRIEGCRIHGYHEGIALCGEHFVCQDNLEIRCYYGFTINNYPSGGALQHPNVFIGNSIEQCYKMGKLGSGNNKTTLVYVGGSVENAITNGSDAPVYMLPIDCLSESHNRGRIESDSLAGGYESSFFYDEQGTNFEQIIYPYAQV